MVRIIFKIISIIIAIIAVGLLIFKTTQLLY
jgi:hypothetical protein